MDTRKRLDQIIDLLRERGNRLTPQRIAILSAFLENDTHPTAEQIHKKILKSFPTTSLATVYKTITLLKDVGEILELEFGDDRSRFDARKPYPHPHMICTECGAIIDSELDALDGIIKELAQHSGFSIQSHRLDIFGLCASCSK